MPNRKHARSTPNGSAGFVTYCLHYPIGDFYDSVDMEGPAWLAFLNGEISGFAYQVREMEFNVRREFKERGGAYWIAYKTISGKRHKHYIGKAEAVTLDRLNDIALLFEVQMDIAQSGKKD